MDNNSSITIRDWAEYYFNKKHTGGDFKKKYYLHLDPKPPAVKSDFIDWAEKILNPTSIVKHSYLPFLRFIQRSVKRRREGGRVIILNKLRPIDYAPHADSIIFAWYAYQLSANYEKHISTTGFSDVATAYRSFGDAKKNNIIFFKEVVDFWNLNQDHLALAFDVKNFFGSMDHALIRKSVREVMGFDQIPDDWHSILKQITHYSYILKDRAIGLIKKNPSFVAHGRLCNTAGFKYLISHSLLQGDTKSNVGIPQGSPISCVIANLYMLNFDKTVYEFANSVGGFYRRYSDDIVLIVPRSAYAEAGKVINSAISERKLKLSEDKTERWARKGQAVFEIDNDGNQMKLRKFSYLGVTYDGMRYYLRHHAIARVQGRIVRSTKLAARYAINMQFEGLPQRKLTSKFGKVNGTFRAYRNRAADALKSKEIRAQYSDRRVETLMKKRRTIARKRILEEFKKGKK